MLASLPARLVAGEMAVAPAMALSPLVLTLIGAWICMLVAAGAVAGLLWGTVALSERRGDFVSAVTHELRTPLTTFRMYSEMLAEGMVADEAKQRRYLNTLRIEAERLSHLVENVLTYARLERGRARGRAEPVTLDYLIARVRDRLADRAQQAGMQLGVDAPSDILAASPRRALAVGEEPAEAKVLADASAVEQILFNLVDNACKYAAVATDRRIHLAADEGGARPALKVCDHGPGISAPDAARLFRPFSKSARDAASSAPGVGLGLALSRRLARDMGGDLAYERRPGDGACFVLALKRSPSARG
jgi:signal transduction histidine kinase